MGYERRIDYLEWNPLPPRDVRQAQEAAAKSLLASGARRLQGSPKKGNPRVESAVWAANHGRSY